MILRSFAELLLQTSPSPGIIGLHLKDTLAAFLVGATTSEGQALSRLHAGHAGAAELAAVTAAIVRLSECDDIHLESCVTPGAVVIPVALAFAGRSGEDDFNRAVAAGYAAGLRLGIAVGGAKALGGGVWPTLLAAPLMAAVTASCLSGHTPDQLAHAMALALGGASGRLGRPAGSPSGRWFLLGESVSKGVRASVAAGEGFRGDLALLSKPWLTAQAGHGDIDIAAFASSAGPALSQVGFKPFPMARQGINAVIALKQLLSNGLDPALIDSVEVFVPAVNVALLGRPLEDGDRLSRLSNLGYQLACAALAPERLYDSARKEPPDAPLMDFASRVKVSPSSELEAYLPNRWAARVVVRASGRSIEETVIYTPLDYEARNLAESLTEKWRRLLSPRDMADFPQAGVP
ncbi:MAG TPA: MmgE/PrpD family protein, partial [Micropepsaceae bacterium]|nr:MmgE/PrpD family protein [Micropepsaceae bacterium]